LKTTRTKAIRNAIVVCTAPLLMAAVPSSGLKNTFIKIEATAPIIPFNSTVAAADNNYTRWNLAASGLSEQVYNHAIKGLQWLQTKQLVRNANIITIADLSKPSWQKRLFVLDLNTGNILFKTWVAHGRNSGLEYAEDFSNTESSYKTSLGFYITMGTYTGANGYSLKLKGCEKGINDNAMQRAIVMHGADYVSTDFLQQNGYLGRSYGCPAIPQTVSKPVIDKIKNGTCLFIYHPEKKYHTKSKILNSKA
jgi:hypothetical protein